jgi:phospholipid/cholesterol/gamma-HCH transport system permease protein
MTTTHAHGPLPQGFRRRMTVPKRPVPFAGTCRTMGEIAWFGAQVLREMPMALALYPSEVARQAGVLVRSNSLIIWFMMFALGAEGGLQGHYILEQVGASGYVGVFNALVDVKTNAASSWGWMLAAKVGCGYVAELGAMRISEEVDALDVMGMRSRAYLVGARLWAMWITGPFLFLSGLGLMYVGSWLVSQPMLQTTSPGAYSDVFWSFQTPSDVVNATVWSMFLATLVVIVGCFYGYHASGGPVGVGKSTAKSMVVNMVLIGVLGVITYQLLFGADIQMPIAN